MGHEYNKKYTKVKSYFGRKPDPVIEQYYHKLDKTGRVLDIGIGQGRNALFLARHGYTVDGIDPAAVSADQVSMIAALEKLPINTFKSSFDLFDPPVKTYSGILLCGVIQVLSRDLIDVLMKRIRQWTGKGSLVFAAAFTTDCPTLPGYTREWQTLGKNSFTNKEGNVRTFLEKGEILTLFKGFKVLHHWEGLGPKHRHGDGPIEQHGMTELVGQL